MQSFPAIVATEKGAPATLTEVPESALPEGDVTVDVHWSSLNYKDGLAVTGRGPVIRSFPMVCGIDLAGTVHDSDSADWSPGDEVIVTGWGLSETHPGGYTTRQRVRAQWLQGRPDGLSLRDSMAIGTGGLTAMLCLMALEEVGIAPGCEGEVLVTGAGGGVGSFAVMLLAGLGYEVAAATGRPEIAEYLTSLGASTIVGRQELAEGSGRPLEKERWAAVIDTVGSQTLATALAQTRSRGAVAACGLAGGSDLPTTAAGCRLRLGPGRGARRRLATVGRRAPAPSPRGRHHRRAVGAGPRVGRADTRRLGPGAGGHQCRRRALIHTAPTPCQVG
jgi:acrylyl-CoA reductase (NADPH)